VAKYRSVASGKNKGVDDFGGMEFREQQETTSRSAGADCKGTKNHQRISFFETPLLSKADFDSRKLLCDFLNVNGICTHTCDIIKMAGA
jgi:hypothetical protein